ncbi:sulfite exporter TauE/SafE family protein [Ancylobacter pratisalsi]|uniref:Probable membrane transporter protein n=1 Tax=Ancylobacter pratisalsi TaxID=1745854 RepID=A0A6P1YNI3_9HYPH|nr:sulfite exporter TauE/SafE family protein [Ancylobacter pratisalsi]QIB34685.1 sulfite exporter TauE/SafE family protein [Ancylobacter pratisalsi]
MDWLMLAAALFVTAASLLRGLTGFGFAIVAMPLLSLVMPPILAVPIVTLLQIPSGVHTIYGDWRDIDLRFALVVWIAGLPTILPGLYLLSLVPPHDMRLMIGAIVLLSTFVLMVGFKLDRSPRTAELIGAGALSGIMQGAAAMAGPPLILLALSSNWPHARSRATLSFVFLLLGSASLVIGMWRGIISADSLLDALILLPGLIVGQYAGTHLFRRLNARSYKVIAITCVAASAAAVITRAFLE